MVRRLAAAVLASAICATVVTSTAQAYIGEGIQGRPHGGHTPQRMLYRRHGLPIPYKYRKHRHHSYNY